MEGSLIISIFEMRKVKLREVKSSGQDQTPGSAAFHQSNHYLKCPLRAHPMTTEKHSTSTSWLSVKLANYLSNSTIRQTMVSSFTGLCLSFSICKFSERKPAPSLGSYETELGQWLLKLL